jgi:hypothetical protein
MNLTRTQVAAWMLAFSALAACTPNAPGRSGDSVATGASAAQHIVIALNGSLGLKRAEWTSFAPAMFGTVVGPSDLLKLDTPAQARLVCADLTVVAVAAGTAGPPCQASRASLNYQGSSVRAARGDESGGYPRVIAPRRTNLLSDRPTIRWTPVPSASGYQVSVRGANVNWTGSVGGAATQMIYPPEAPPLTSGVSFKVTVVAFTPGGPKSSDQEQSADLGFTVLDSEGQQRVITARDRVDGLSLEPAQRQFVTSRLYMADENRLYAEAADALESIYATLNGEPSVPRALGDVYRSIGLNALAEEHYTTAASLSQQRGDTAGQAAALDALAELASAQGNAAEAGRRARQSLEIFQLLGDASKTRELQDRLAGSPPG